MPRLLGKTRFLILFPIIGLAIAACVLFILGGLGLLRLLANVVLQSFGVRTTTMLEPGQGAMIFSIVEFVHTFLVGTVLTSRHSRASVPAVHRRDPLPGLAQD